MFRMQRSSRWLLLALIMVGLLVVMSGSPDAPVAAQGDGSDGVPTYTSVSPTPYTSDGEAVHIELQVQDDNAFDMLITRHTDETLGEVSIAADAPMAAENGHTVRVVVTYIPPEDFSGDDSFSLDVSDADGNVLSIPVTVSVAGQGDGDAAAVDTTGLTKELILHYPKNIPDATLTTLLDSVGAVEVERIPEIGAVRVLVPEGVTGESFRGAMRTRGFSSMSTLRTEVEEPAVMTGFGYDPTPTDAGFASQWGVSSTEIGSMYAANITPGVDGAWELTNYDLGKTVVVAVLDTGLDYSNPEFAGRSYLGYDFVNDSPNPQDDNGHGTRVSGTIAANFGSNPGGGTNGIVGVAPLTYVMPVKVCDSLNSCDVFDVAQGIIYAVDNGPKVINISFGTCQGVSTTVYGAIQYALYHDITIVAAAGNGTAADGSGCEGDPTQYAYPASHEGVISVTAHDIDGNASAFSSLADGEAYNQNDAIDVSAPGIGIYSSDLSNNYTTNSGTSYAAAHASGLAAILVSSGVATVPEDVMEAMKCSATEQNGFEDYYGAGRLRADRAVTWDSNSSDCHLQVPHDDIENAELFWTLPYKDVTPLHARTVSSQASDPEMCNKPVEFSTVWYQFYTVNAGYYLLTTLGSRTGNAGDDGFGLDTVMTIYSGEPNALQEIRCNDDLGVDTTVTEYSQGTSNILTYLPAGQYFYVAIGVEPDALLDVTLEPLETSARLEFNVVQAIQDYNYYPAWAGNMIQIGMWEYVASAASPGGYIMQSRDEEAAVQFAMRGVSLEYWRSVGPLYGDAHILVNGLPIDNDLSVMGSQPVNNRATYEQHGVFKTLALDDAGPQYDNPGQWVIITVHPETKRGTTAGPLPLNYFRPLEESNYQNLLTHTFLDNSWTLYDNETTYNYVLYDGTWDVDGTTSNQYYGTYSRTTQPGATVTFKSNGDGAVFYRNLTPDGGMMDIYVDGSATAYATNVSNCNSAGIVKQVPFYLLGLGNWEHNITIVNKTYSTGDASDPCDGNTAMEADALRPVNQIPMHYSTYGVGFDFDAIYWQYPGSAIASESLLDYFWYANGNWTKATGAVPGATNNVVLQTSDPDASLEFSFTGSYFCLDYGEAPGNGQMEVYINDLNRLSSTATPVHTIDMDTVGGAGVQTWCSANPNDEENADAYGVLPYGTYRVELVMADTDPLTAGKQVAQVQIDNVNVFYRKVLEPAEGLVYFNSPDAFTYSEPNSWIYPQTWQGDISDGGYWEYLIRFTNASADDTAITFYMSGSGFVLYTSIGGEAIKKMGQWEVIIDGSPVDYEVLNTDIGRIELSVGRDGTPAAYSPFAFGFADMDELDAGIHKVTLKAYIDNNEAVDFTGVRILP